MSPRILRSIALVVIFPMIVPVLSPDPDQTDRQEVQCGTYIYSGQDSADDQISLAPQKSPFTFWDEPPGSCHVIYVNDQAQILPGPEDEIKVIIQLEGETVAQLKARLEGVTGQFSTEDEAQIKEYADELRHQHALFLNELDRSDISFEPGLEYTFLLNGIAGKTPMMDLQPIESIPGVKKVHLDFQMHAFLDESVPLIGADQVWEMQDPNGDYVTGLGMQVAVIDSGVDYTHPDLGGGFGHEYKVMAGYDFVNLDDDPFDDFGHGTHVAGIVAANGLVKGVAPEANLFAYKVLDNYGYGWVSDVIAAIEKATNPDDDPLTADEVDVINLSLGGPGTPEDALSSTVDGAVDQGVIVAAAAGNVGPEYMTVSSPGVARKAFTVGASDKSDVIGIFSARGPVLDDLVLIKPDILAPGVDINSTVPASGPLGSPDRYLELSGTSMATPHIAGASALIKQLHPNWTPEMVRASLMNTAKDLAQDVYTQGAGRVQVNVAAQTPTLVSPASLGFGKVDLAQSMWTHSRDFTVTNLAPMPADYTLQVEAGLPEGVTTTLDPESFTLDAGESATTTLSISVDNNLVPIPARDPLAYEGKVRVQVGSESSLIPFSFIKAAELKLAFDKEPLYVLVHNREDVFFSRWFFEGLGTRPRFLLPSGNYDVIVEYKDGLTRVFKENVQVETTTQLAINKSDANHLVMIKPVDVNNRILRTYADFNEVIRLNQSDFFMIISSTFQRKPWRFSTMSEAYTWDWGLTTGVSNNRDVYDIYGFAHQGIDKDITFQNLPADFKHVTFQYFPPPDQEKNDVLHWTRMELPSLIFGSSVLIGGAPLKPPYSREIYMMPRPYPEFPFSQFEELHKYRGFPYFNPSMTTPLIEAKDNQTIEGTGYPFCFREEAGGLFSTTASWLPFGLMPPHWAARMDNKEDRIQLKISRDCSGGWQWLFNNQMKDVSRYPELPYELYREGVLIRSGMLRTRLPLPAAGSYQLRVTHAQYYLSGQPGIATVLAEFNTRLEDKNPPYLKSLQVLNNGKLTNTLVVPGGNQLRFVLEDDTALAQVRLWISQDGNLWDELTLVQSASEFTADLPELPNHARISFKISAVDTHDNSLTYVVDPAFTIEFNQIFFPLSVRAY